MDHMFQRRQWYAHHVGNVGCHIGDDRTWCMVRRCASVRPEAFRDFRALDGFLSSPEGGSARSPKSGCRSTPIPPSRGSRLVIVRRQEAITHLALAPAGIQMATRARPWGLVEGP